MAIKIKELKHRIAICRMKDVVVASDRMILLREAVVWTRAKIEHQQHLPSFVSVDGYAIKELTTRATHRIRVRAQLELDYTSAAWIYEEFLKSPPRWYKVLGFVDEDERVVMLECHLVESSEEAKISESSFTPERMQVKL